MDADRLVRSAFAAAVPSAGDPRASTGFAVVAVGGYGRSELSPSSDVDVVLVHDPDADGETVAAVAEALWYPLWDAGLKLDHAVRASDAMRAAARDDVKVAMGLLDARPVAGDSGMVLALRSEALADWRRDARRRIEEVRAERATRLERAGWIAHSAVPDLKEGGGGLRDGVVLRALVATWLVDAPHGEVEQLRSDLLQVRDALHDVTGRATDRLDPDVLPDVAARLGMAPLDLDGRVRQTGRRLAHVVGRTWRRLDDTLALSASRAGRRPVGVLEVGPGVGILDHEVVMTASADPAGDPEVALRLAATAARAGLPLGAGTAARLAERLGDLPEPWPERARRAMVDLLTAGPGLPAVWDELDFAGVVDRWLPEWSDIRLRGSSSPVHRFTVDRHSTEVCVQVAARLRGVDRPDLLAVAALLHDIGKARPGDHSEVGEPMAVEIARRWGFDAPDAEDVGELVRWHLLLPTVATRRDIEDPATAANVAAIVGSERVLDRLAALTAADAVSTSPQAWSPWRQGLIEGLVAKVRSQLTGAVDPEGEGYEGWPDHVPFPDLSASGLRLTVDAHRGGSLVTVVTDDAPGLLARLAGALALAGVDLQSLRTVTRDGTAVSLWETPRTGLDVAALTERIRPALDGAVDLDLRLDRPAKGDDNPRVRLLERPHATATLVEVHALDRRGLIYLVARAITAAGGSIRSAHVSTYGSEVRDVFYVVGVDGGPLDASAAEGVRAAVDGALG